MKLCDGGSSYFKILDTETEEFHIVPTKNMVSDDNYRFEYGTGYVIRKKSGKFINQLITMFI